ncbi:MAG: S1 RNA-binding domain-containing protein, partial [Acidimicrobiales bacterium]|nr:S1 RNA-binding domain-containing protein [Acidimicrobiales bacterium]
MLESPPMGTFDENGEYNPRPITENDLGSLTLEEAYAATLVDVANGQLVEGTVVRIDRDEVLVDIGYKSEGVIPQKELSIRNNADPGDVVALGEQIEALVLQREDA